MDQAEDDEQPPEPAHLGGETPTCSGVSAVKLAVWMAERALTLSKPADAKEAKKLIARVKKPRPEDAGLLRGYGLVGSDDSPATQIARFAVRGARSLAEGRDDSTWVATAAASARMVPIVRDAEASVMEFLRELDRRILAEEMVTAAARHAKAPADFDIARVHWRGPDLFLGQMSGSRDRFALVGKLGKTWSLLTGTRDEMLASVPDVAFEEATRAFLDTKGRK